MGRNIDKPHYGWEGVSNSGEIYNNQGNFRKNKERDILEEAQEIRTILDSIELPEEKIETVEHIVENSESKELLNLLKANLNNIFEQPLHQLKEDVSSNKRR